MRKYIKFKLLGLAFLVAALAGCDTATQEVSEVVSPDGYPMVTFTTDFTGTSLAEGDTIVYTITMDKMLDRSVTFRATQTGGDADGHDIIVEPAVMSPYTLETELLIICVQDNNPEVGESYTAEIGATSLADKYLVNQDVVNPTISFDVANVNDPTLLTVVLSWGTDADIDIVTWSNTTTYPMTEWGAGGATGANPEIDQAIWLADPVGTYFVDFMHWGAPPFDYVLTLGYPDGSVDVIEGFFDSDNLDNYILDPWTAWGGSYPSYRILEVENDGSVFTVTVL